MIRECGNLCLTWKEYPNIHYATSLSRNVTEFIFYFGKTYAFITPLKYLLHVTY